MLYQNSYNEIVKEYRNGNAYWSNDLNENIWKCHCGLEFAISWFWGCYEETAGLLLPTFLHPKYPHPRQRSVTFRSNISSWCKHICRGETFLEFARIVTLIPYFSLLLQTNFIDCFLRLLRRHFIAYTDFNIFIFIINFIFTMKICWMINLKYN